MDPKLDSILSVILLPQTIWLISEKEGIDETKALDEFYHSKTYSLLAKEETKMWHYSPLTLYTIWKSEKETGEPCFPEE